MKLFKKSKETEQPVNINLSGGATITYDINEPHDPLKGLTQEEIELRLQKNLINGDQNIKTKSVGEILKTNIFTFFNFLFFALALILFFFIPQNISGYTQFGFMGLVIINMLIGIIQELRAKKTIDKLSLISAPRVIAIRDGKPLEISVSEILLHETVQLAAGDQVCADGVVIEGCIEVNESQITGEPDAIVKNVGDEVMSGSYIVSGKALTKVIHIGKDNYATKISAGAKYLKKPNSEILRSLNSIVKFMAFIILPLGIALFCMKYFAQSDLQVTPLKGDNLVKLLGWGDNDKLGQTVITTIGTMIGMIPSGLVALSSTVFCISVIRLSRHKTLAQDLYCVETLARVDVLCLDKTGTITEGSMQVVDMLPEGVLIEEFKRILKNLDSAVKDDNATAQAIREYLKDIEKSASAKSIIPFSSARKWSGAVFDDAGYVLGAPEFVFGELTESQKEHIKKFAENGNRVLALAKTNKELSDKNLPPAQFLGYILITDKIRAEAPDTLRFFKEQGVTIKVISGDNPVTVKSVAKRAGLEDADNYIDLSTLKTEEEVMAAAEKYTIFGRVTPDQKLMLVKALKRNKHTVAMTGDGVNDVLALKEADCSVAMASGSDAAKNVSSLVLLDSNFASMPKVVAEGRRSINNLERSASLFIVKTIYSFLFAFLFMFIPAELPFAPTDMTIIGAMTIGIPSFLLALEPNRERIQGRFLLKVMSNALPGSLTVVFSVMAVVFASSRYTFPAADIRAMYFILTAFASFLYLGKVCYPFNILRFILYAAMMVAFALCFVANFPNLNIPEMFGMPQKITWQMGKVMMVIAAIDIPIFAALVLSLSRLRNPKLLEKITKKLEQSPPAENETNG
ncbi:MAG: HAD-IC family P-type ATPase [Clostridiales bacterium]|nr:HAD-IC family P-type ATPase [Clostridiales bacterium]